MSMNLESGLMQTDRKDKRYMYSKQSNTNYKSNENHIDNIQTTSTIQHTTYNVPAIFNLSFNFQTKTSRQSNSGHEWPQTQ